MPVEDQIRRGPGQEQATKRHSFDELAKGMARGAMSRKRALKVLVGALLGGSLLAALPSVSGAQEQHIGGGGRGGHRHHHHHHHHHGFCPKGRQICGSQGERFCCPRGTECVQGECVTF